MCRALAAAHNAGIIHRDLKPENVFLIVREGTTDFVKILDFGIAKSAEFEEQRKDRLTHPGMAMGTPEYMAPEQAAGRPADARSDVYAVGAILYEMLTGDPPYEGENFMEILTKKATVDPMPPRQLRPELPDLVERVLLRALARDPALRPPSMEAFEYELTKCLAGRGIAVAKMLGMPVDPAAMSPIVIGSDSVPPEMALAAGPVSEPPRGELVSHSGRVAVLGLAALGSPKAAEEELAETTAVVTVPKSSLRWMAYYAAAVVVGGTGVAWYAYQHQDRAAHRPADIVAVVREDPPPPPQPLPVAAPAAIDPGAEHRGAPHPAETSGASVPEPPPPTSAPTVAPPPPNIVVRPPDTPQSDLYLHTVERTRPPSERIQPTGADHEGPPRDRKEAEGLLTEARADATQMDWQKARAIYERIAKGRFKRAEGLLGLANVSWQTNDVESAIVFAQKALEAGGGEAAHMMLGHAYLKKGLLDEATSQYHAVLQKNPQSREAQRALREAQRQMQKN
jgi:hypothetical protein